MCFDICTINIRESTRVRGLHLVGKGFAPLRVPALWKLLRGCGWAMAAACSWGGRISLTVCFLYVIALRCCGQTVGNISQAVWFCTFFAAARMKVESTLQALCSCTCLWKLHREKHLRMTQCVFHIRASQPRSMWNVHSQHSSWNRSLLCLALDLDFWLSFGYRSGPRPRNRKCTFKPIKEKQPSQERFPQWRFCWERKQSPHHAEHYATCPSGQHWMERFLLSVFAKGKWWGQHVSKPCKNANGFLTELWWVLTACVGKNMKKKHEKTRPKGLNICSFLVAQP